MFDKIFQFIEDYEDLLKFCLFFFGFICLLFYVVGVFDRNLTRDKSIIESTKDYVIYHSCSSFDGVWYCWND